MSRPWWTATRGEGPIVAVAIHAGHEVRGPVRSRLALKSLERRREEDPFTDVWAAIAPTRMVMHRSRFEVDLNRPRDHAVYRKPEDAWGLQVWRTPADDDFIAESLVIYDSFYDQLRLMLNDVEKRYGYFVLLDLHNYNFKRNGAQGRPEDPALNPDVNIGTDGMPRERWAPVLDAFIDGLRRHEYRGRPLDVRENVRFRGGHLPHWVHGNFINGCAIAVEIKKFFMDEWTGQPVPGGVDAVTRSLETGLSHVRKQLET